MVFWRKSRERRARLSAVADRVGARTGTVLLDAFSGGGANGPLCLGVVTLRTGDSGEVLRAQIDAVVAAGYAPPGHLRADECAFVDNPGLPMLTISTYAAGKVIPQHGEVPSGQTGVVVSLA
ncbi:hypothetical protein [Amycolatopsis sp. NPDC049159]|uniref:hypothetical protein n=1 Tax=Amycolatopsis sp. NPDC049159 TaxID=3157210 RepID=UPI0033EF1568